MKKAEAISLAPEKSKIIISYIMKILEIDDYVEGKIDLGVAKINNMHVCVAHVLDPTTGLERHIDLEITSDHFYVLVSQLLKDFITTFLPHEDFWITKHYMIRSMQTNFSGIDAGNNLGSRVKINLGGSGQEYKELILKYERQYDEFVQEINRENEGKIL